MVNSRRLIRHVGVVLVGALGLAWLVAAPGNDPPARATGYDSIALEAGTVPEGPATDLGQEPMSVAVENGTLYVADTVHCVLRAVDLVTGEETTAAGTGTTGNTEPGAAAQSRLIGPTLVRPDGQGGLYLADSEIDDLTSGGQLSELSSPEGSAPSPGGSIATTYAEVAGMATSPAGQLYFSDAQTESVWRVNSDGTLSRVAGDGISGTAGDGGPATAAELAAGSLAFDSQGDLFIADPVDSRVREVSPSGTISTFFTFSSGSGLEPGSLAVSPSGALDATVQNAVVQLNANGTLSSIAGSSQPGFGGDGGLATSAELNAPRDIAFDAQGDLFIADAGNYRVREVSVGGVITTVAGNGTLGTSAGRSAAGLEMAGPAGMAVGPSGDLYVSDYGDDRILAIDAAGTDRLVAGGSPGTGGDNGPATSAQLYSSSLGSVSRAEPGLAFDSKGDLFVADPQNRRIREISPSGTITTVVQEEDNQQAPCVGENYEDGSLQDSTFVPIGVATDSAGNLYFTSSAMDQVCELSTSGQLSVVAGEFGVSGYSGDGGPATAATLSVPTGLAVDPSGEIYVVDSGNGCIREIGPGGTITTYAGANAPDHIGDPLDVAVDPSGNVYATVANAVYELGPGAVATALYAQATAESGPLSYDGQIAYDSGSVYVANWGSNQILRITLSSAAAGGGGSSGTSTTTTSPDATTTTLGTTSQIYRAAGSDRIATAIAVSQASFPSAASATSVVLARSDDFADALAGTALAVAKDGPLLITPPDELDSRVKAEVTRVLPPGRTIYLLGGDAAISPATALELTSAGYAVIRLAGEDRFGTAVAIAQALGNPATVVEVTGTDFADALSVGPMAAELKAAVLLTDGSSMPEETLTYLAEHPTDTRYAVGGPAASADPVASAVVGGDRYDTSAKVAQRFFANPGAVGIASGTSFPDGLSGGALLGREGWPLLLTDPDGLPVVVHAYLSTNSASIRAALIFGGTASVSVQISQQIQAALQPSQ